MSKKILFVTAFAPGNAGAGQHYTARLLENLSEDYDIDLIYFKYDSHKTYTPDSSKIKLLKEIRIRTPSRLLSSLKIPFLHPAFTNRFYFSVAAYIRKIAPDYDLLYFDFYQTFIYASPSINMPKVLMVHDVLTQKYLRTARNFPGRLWAYYCRVSEKYLLSRAQGTIVCFSEKDRILLQRYFSLPSLKTDFIPDERIRTSDPTAEPLLPGLCFYGAWSRPENSRGLEWFLDRVLPLCDFEVSFYILGSGIPDRLYEKCKADPRIVLLGFLENPYPVLASFQGLIAPLFEGAGVKVKVLEALSCGLPVAGTETTFEGIDVRPPGAVWLCSTPEEFAEAAKCMMKKPISDKKYIREYFVARYPSVTFKDLLKQLV